MLNIENEKRIFAHNTMLKLHSYSVWCLIRSCVCAERCRRSTPRLQRGGFLPSLLWWARAINSLSVMKTNSSSHRREEMV